MQVAFTFISVIVSTVNFLEVTPVRHVKCRRNREDALTNVDFALFVPLQLFFLGSTLVFIGFDLLYEWIVDVRHKVSRKISVYRL